MKLSEATKMAKEMIALHVPGAEFAGYTSSRKTLGCAGISAGKQFIKLSSVFVQLAEEKAVRNTIAHECAHLLAYRRFGTFGHDKHFYNMCAVTGAAPKRLNCDQKVSEALSSASAYRGVIAKDGKVAKVTDNSYQNRPRKDLTSCWLGNDRSTEGCLWYCETKNAKVGLSVVRGIYWQK